MIKKVILILAVFVMSALMFMNCDLMRLLSREEYLDSVREKKKPGSLDSSQFIEDVTFVKTMNFGTGDDQLDDIVIDGEYIYLAGNDTTISPTNSQMRLEKRYKSNGELESSFGNNGVIQYNFSNLTMKNDEEAYSYIEYDNNYIYLGCYYYISTIDRVWQIQKRDKNTGNLVNTFGNNGIIVINPSSGNDLLFTMSSDEYYIYIAGEDRFLSNTDGQWHIEKRYKADGSLVTSFKDNGIYQNNYSERNDSLYNIAIDSSFIYASGMDGINGGQWHIEKINKFTGILESLFGTNGILLENFGGYDDRCGPIILDNDYMYLAGSFEVNKWTAHRWRIEKRNLITGAFDYTFGNNGSIDEYLSEFGNKPLWLYSYNENIYISGNNSVLESSSEDLGWRIEKRNIINGAFSTEFGINGVIHNNYSSGNDSALKIITDNNYIYIGGFDTINGNRQWRFEKRKLATGGF